MKLFSLQWKRQFLERNEKKNANWLTARSYIRYIIISGNSESIRKFQGSTCRVSMTYPGNGFSMSQVKSESERIRFLTCGGHVQVCLYSRGIRVRIVWFQHRITPHFTQCKPLNFPKAVPKIGYCSVCNQCCDWWILWRGHKMIGSCNCPISATCLITLSDYNIAD